MAISWEVVEGRGEECLETIINQARSLRLLSNGGVSNLTARMGGYTTLADVVADDILETLTLTGSLGGLEAEVDALDKQDLRDLALARAGEYAVRKLTRADNAGKKFKDVRRVRLTPQVAGVYLQKRVLPREPGSPEDELASRIPKISQLDVGVPFETNIRSFMTRPHLGGLMEINKMLTTTYVWGLVNPATLEPKVKLEVLRQASQKA